MRKTGTPASELSYRVPMSVTQIRLFPTDGAYPVCPRCHISMERERQSFCSRCGQRLAWKEYRRAQIIFPQSSPGAVN